MSKKASVKTIRPALYINDVNASSTLRELNARSKELRNHLQHIPRDSQNFKALSAQLRATRKEIQKTNRELYTTDNALRRAADTVNRYFNLGVTTIASLVAGFTVVRNFTESLAELSDVRADVQKTTNLTNEELDELQKRFDAMRTRTSRVELLKLAAVAGKLGTKGVEDIAKFVEQGNKINVALGEDLGEDAVLMISKTANVFDTEMETIGSAINEVADNTKASAPFLVNWLSRLAGISKAVDIHASEVIGYGAVLDELGLRVEMSSTALNGFFADFVRESGKFERAAGMQEGALAKLIGEQGTNAGFLGFLEALNRVSPTQQDFLRKLEEVGISGDRKSQVFLALSQNIDLVRERQSMANAEMENATSITEEYNRKNDNLAGKLERLGRWARRQFINSAVLHSIESFVGYLERLVSIPVSETIRQERVDMMMLQAQILDSNTSQEERVKLINKLQDMYPGYLKNLNAETISNTELSNVLAQINDNLVNKIMLQSKEEQVTEAARAKASIEEQRLDILNKMQEALLKLSGYDFKASDIAGEAQTLATAMQVLNSSGIGQVGTGASGMTNVNSQYHKLSALMAQFNATSVHSKKATEDLNNVLKSKAQLIKALGIDLGTLNEEMAKGQMNELEVKAQAFSKAISDGLKQQGLSATELATKLKEQGLQAYDLLMAFYRSDFASFKDFQQAKLQELGFSQEAITKMLNDSQNKQLLSTEQGLDIDLEKRAEAQAKIEAFLAKANDDEIEQTRLKYEKLLKLAEKFGIDQTELLKAMKKEIQTLTLTEQATDWENEQKRLWALASKSTEQYYNYQKGLILEEADAQKWTQEDLHNTLLNAEIAYLREMIELRKEFGMETIDLETKIAEKQKEIADAKLQSDQAIRESMEHTIFMAASQANKEEVFGRVIINAIRRRMQAYLAEYLAKTLIESVGTGLLGGLTGAIAAASAGALFNAVIPRFNTGGYTSSGIGVPDPFIPGRKIAGVVHDNEYVVAREEMMRPDVAAMVAAIDGVRQSRYGNYAKGQSINKTINNSQTINIDPLLDSIAMLNQTLMEIREKGILAIADTKFRRDLEELQNIDQTIKSNSEL